MNCGQRDEKECRSATGHSESERLAPTLPPAKPHEPCDNEVGKPWAAEIAKATENFASSGEFVGNWRAQGWD